jgi:hypothetical protein
MVGISPIADPASVHFSCPISTFAEPRFYTNESYVTGSPCGIGRANQEAGKIQKNKNRYLTCSSDNSILAITSKITIGGV